MNQIETIQLRPYRPADKMEAINVFSQLILSNTVREPKSILLLADTTVECDLCIVLVWPIDTHLTDKSAFRPPDWRRSFSEFGRIDYSVWSCMATINQLDGILKNRSHNQHVPGSENAKNRNRRSVASRTFNRPEGVKGNPSWAGLLAYSPATGMGGDLTHGQLGKRQ